MKTFLFILFLLVFSIISLPLYPVMALLKKKDERLQARAAQNIVCFALRILLFISGAKITVKGRERIPRQAVLFVSNHRSYFDIIIQYVYTPHLTGFVAKKELAKVPCISHWMRLMHCLFLDRENIREGMKTILQAIDYLKDGYSIQIAPEGTRNHGEDMLPFKEGSFKIAEKAGAPIVPVAINNADAIFEKHIPWVRKAHVIMEYGEPIETANLSREEKKALPGKTREIIREMLERNGKEI